MASEEDTQALNVLKNRITYSYRIGSNYADHVRNTTAKQYEVDVYEGQLEFYGVVLSAEDGKEYIGTSRLTTEVTQARCFIPKIHACYPLPRNEQDHQIIDLFPMFQGSKDKFGKEIKPGSLVRVKFADRNKTSQRVGNGKIIELLNETQANAVGIGFRLQVCIEKPLKSRVNAPPGENLWESCNDLVKSVENPKTINSQWAESSTINDCRSTGTLLGTSRPSYSEHKRVGLIAEKPTGVATCKTATILSNLIGGSGGSCKNNLPLPTVKPGSTLKQFMEALAGAESGGKLNPYLVRRATVYKDKKGKKVMPNCSGGKGKGKPRGSQYWGKYQLGNAARLEAFKRAVDNYKNPGHTFPLLKKTKVFGSEDMDSLITNHGEARFLETQIPSHEKGGGKKTLAELMCDGDNWMGAPPPSRWWYFQYYLLKGNSDFKGKNIQEAIGACWFDYCASQVINDPTCKAIINKSNKWGKDGDVSIKRGGNDYKIDLSSLVAVRHLLGMGGVKKYLQNPADNTNADDFGTTAQCYAMKFFGYNLWDMTGLTK
jgi:hypothetical protein